MNTNRRNFTKTAAALLAGALVLPAIGLPATKPSATFVVEDPETGWAWMVWGGDVDVALKFGNTGPCPLWGDDWKINPETQCVEFLSIFPFPSSGMDFQFAKLGDSIMRAPNGVFFRLPQPTNFTKWRIA